jgi:hypothetical protein
MSLLRCSEDPWECLAYHSFHEENLQTADYALWRAGQPAVYPLSKLFISKRGSRPGLLEAELRVASK